MPKIKNSSCLDITVDTFMRNAFNNRKFSNQVLHIKVIEDSSDSTPCKKKSKVNVVEEKTLNLNYLTVAVRSTYFEELLNAKGEVVTLTVRASDYPALMDILKFMYDIPLSATKSQDLLDILRDASNYRVTSCMSHCISLMVKKMSQKSAVSYLQLPSNVLKVEVVQPLITSAKEYLIKRLSDLKKSRKEVMVLPLCAVEVILGSSRLQVDSENDVCDFIIKWASENYPKPEERQKIIAGLLEKCIRFRYMSGSKLKKIAVSPDFANEKVSKLALEALASKEKYPFHTNSSSSRVRVYNYRLVKVVPVEFPQPRCIVYFDLTKEECKNLFTSSGLRSEIFSLGGRSFYLSAKCSTKEEQNSFGLFLNMTKESESCSLDHKFAVMNKSSKEFKQIRKSKFSNSELLSSCGYPNLLGISWVEFMKKGNEYFIDGILHLQADLAINISKA